MVKRKPFIPERTLKAIEKGAKEATPGPWQYAPPENECAYSVFTMNEKCVGGGICLPEDPYPRSWNRPGANMKHVARMDPETTLAMVDEIRALREIVGIMARDETENNLLLKRVNESVEARNMTLMGFLEPTPSLHTEIDGKRAYAVSGEGIERIIELLEVAKLQTRGNAEIEEFLSKVEDRDNGHKSLEFIRTMAGKLRQKWFPRTLSEEM